MSSDPAKSAAVRTRLTDAHLHVWQLDASEYAWLRAAPEHLRAHVDEAEALAAIEQLGADRVVLVQADDTQSDTRRLLDLASRWEGCRSGALRADVVGWMDLTEPALVHESLTDPARESRLVGVRQLIHDDPDPGILDRPAVADSLDLIAAAGLAFDVPDAFPRHMVQVGRVAQEHPSLRVVLDHLGKPPLGEADGMRWWAREIEALAEIGSVFFKISGLATSGDGYFTADPVVGDVVGFLLDLAGPQRCLFGSDWPIAPRSRLMRDGAIPLRDHIVRTFPECADQILHGTAERVYRRREGPEVVSAACPVA